MSVFGLVSAIAGFVKVRFLEDKEVIDNIIFRCHYRITSAILFVACILCTATGLIGNPIDCIAGGAFKDQEKVINTYCWITSTFTLPTHRQYGVSVAPHIGTHLPGEPVIRHAYYQWVPFVLFLQGVLFYIPHWVWKNWEEGKIKTISNGLRGSTIEKKEERCERQSKLAEYLFQSLHLHESYAMCYFICEILNFINVIGNIFFLNTFLGGSFLQYGTRILAQSGLDQEKRDDPMIEIFPRLTKCTFHKYGSSGNIALAAFPQMRKTILERRFKYRTPGGVQTLIDSTKVGDFLILHLLGQNMCSYSFHDLLEQLISKLSNYKLFPTAPSTLEMRPIYPSKEVNEEM
ncbi:Innexin inx3 [Blattella germanica]|nr:Innexin inx3 [Blattella germanica]